MISVYNFFYKLLNISTISSFWCISVYDIFKLYLKMLRMIRKGDCILAARNFSEDYGIALLLSSPKVGPVSEK